MIMSLIYLCSDKPVFDLFPLLFYLFAISLFGRMRHQQRPRHGFRSGWFWKYRQSGLQEDPRFR